MVSIKEIILLFFLLLVLLYCIRVFGLINFLSFSRKDPSINPLLQQNISLVVPFHNEEKNLPRLLSCLEKQINIEQFELIFVDDHSNDAGAGIVTNWAASHPTISLKLLLNSKGHQGKKSCIVSGINQASSSWILCIDADINFSIDFLFSWKQSLIHIDPEKVFIPGLIFPESKTNSFIESLADVEQVMLTGFTLATARTGKPILASGANMLLKKEWFLQKNPFLNNMQLQSGDDMFMLQAALPLGVGYNNDPRCFAYTHSPNNWTHFFKQRKRWLGKVKYLKIPSLQKFGIISLFGLVLPWFSLLLFNNTGFSFVLLFMIWILPFIANITFYYQVTLLQNKTQNIFKLFLIYLLYPFVLLKVVYE
jgi:cellulose synthase/poly-beta-1,6-N-acetylglucosamine synthase-like glycosyltransferase